MLPATLSNLLAAPQPALLHTAPDGQSPLYVGVRYPHSPHSRAFSFALPINIRSTTVAFFTFIYLQLLTYINYTCRISTSTTATSSQLAASDPRTRVSRRQGSATQRLMRLVQKRQVPLGAEQHRIKRLVKVDKQGEVNERYVQGEC